MSTSSLFFIISTFKSTGSVNNEIAKYIKYLRRFFTPNVYLILNISNNEFIIFLIRVFLLDDSCNIISHIIQIISFLNLSCIGANCLVSPKHNSFFCLHKVSNSKIHSNQ